MSKFPESAKFVYHHTGIFVSNLERSIEWYCRVMGYRHVYTRYARLRNLDNSGTFFEMPLAFLSHNGHYLELYEMVNAAPFTYENYMNTLGTKHLDLTLPDDQYDLVRQHFIDEGVSFAVGGPEDGAGPLHSEKTLGKPGGLKVMYIRDPDGILIEINGEFIPENYFPGLNQGQQK